MVQSVPGTVWQNAALDFHGVAVNRWVKVQPKEWGLVAATTDQREALLIFGFYGLGRSAVLTTGFSPEWGGTWMEQHAADIGRQLMAWLTEPQRTPIQISTQYRENSLEVRVALHDSGVPRHNEQWRLWCGNASQPAELVEIGAGRYQRTLPLDSFTEERLVLQQKQHEEWRTQAVCQLALPRAAELQRLGWRPLALENNGFCRPPSERQPNPFWLLSIVTVVFFIESWIRLRRMFYGSDQSPEIPVSKA